MRGFISFCVFCAVSLCWKIADHLAAGAISGWIDDKIGERLGMTSPATATVIIWIIALGPPLVGTGALLFLYHLWHTRHSVGGPAPAALGWAEKIASVEKKVDEDRESRRRIGYRTFLAPKQNGPPSATLQWESGLSPLRTPVPNSGEVLAWRPFRVPGQKGHIGQSRSSGSPGGDIGWGTNIVWLHKCTLTSWGKETIFDVRMTVSASFFRTEPTQNGGLRQGEFIETATQDIVIPQLESGRQNSFVVYVPASDPNHMCRVNLPE